MQQVVLNLIVNAIEAIRMHPHNVREIKISTYPDGPDIVHVAVRDSGVGLGTGDPQRLFDSFYTSKPHGMGVGLSISRQIVLAHGGRIWGHANDGDDGATFHFSLPVPTDDV
jgi:two-component system sensor kinase FixL